MFDFDYRITPPKSEKIMKAQDGEDVGEYKLSDVHLEYEIIESEDLVRKVKDQYSIGRSLFYDYTTLLKTLPWSKSSTREVIDVNIPRRSMKAIVVLFTKKDSGDSEDLSSQNSRKSASRWRETPTTSTRRDSQSVTCTGKLRGFSADRSTCPEGSFTQTNLRAS